MEQTTVNIAETLSTSLTDVANQAVSAIGTILPTALIVMGAVMVITIGVKLFKKFSK